MNADKCPQRGNRSAGSVGDYTRMLLAGHTLEQIGKSFGVSHGAVRKALKAAGLPTNSRRQHAEIERLRNSLKFVERWANHHAAKPSITAPEALSVIQHYPPIKAITLGYADGKVPETPDPFAEVERLRADAARYQWLAQDGERIGERIRAMLDAWDGCDGKAGFDATIDAAMRDAP